MDHIPETDWKVFKRHHLIAHERFCLSASSEIRSMLSGQEKSIINLFQEASIKMDSFMKEEKQLFCDYRRSTALGFIRQFYFNKLLSDFEISEYSAEVQALVRL